MQSQYISYQHILLLSSISKTSHLCLHLMWNTLTQKDQEALNFINMQMLIENFQCVLSFPHQFNTSHKNQEVFIRLIMGLGGHDNWVRDEFLANMEVKSGNPSKTPKSPQHINKYPNSNLISSYISIQLIIAQLINETQSLSIKYKLKTFT